MIETHKPAAPAPATTQPEIKKIAGCKIAQNKLTSSKKGDRNEEHRLVSCHGQQFAHEQHETGLRKDMSKLSSYGDGLRNTRGKK
jgi:hypothetical protein